MRPQPEQVLLVLELVVDGLHSLEHLGQIPHVVHIVTLRGRGKELPLDGVVDSDSTLDNDVHLLHQLLVRLDSRHPPLHNHLVDVLEGLVGELRNGNDIEVPEIPRSDSIPASSWGTHGTHELDVDQGLESVVRSLIPTPVVHPLPQHLNRRLGAVDLELGHVQIVHKDDALCAKRGSKNTLPALVELTINQILNLVRVGPGTEGRLNVLVCRLVQ